MQLPVSLLVLLERNSHRRQDVCWLLSADVSIVDADIRYCWGRSLIVLTHRGHTVVTRNPLRVGRVCL